MSALQARCSVAAGPRTVTAPARPAAARGLPPLAPRRRRAALAISALSANEVRKEGTAPRARFLSSSWPWQCVGGGRRVSRAPAEGAAGGAAVDACVCCSGVARRACRRRGRGARRPGAGRTPGRDPPGRVGRGIPSFAAGWRQRVGSDNPARKAAEARVRPGTCRWPPATAGRPAPAALLSRFFPAGQHFFAPLGPPRRRLPTPPPTFLAWGGRLTSIPWPEMLTNPHFSSLPQHTKQNKRNRPRRRAAQASTRCARRRPCRPPLARRPPPAWRAAPLAAAAPRCSAPS
jgi:hypothetical protein